MDDDEIEALIEQEVDESTSSPKKDDESDGEKKKERKYRKKERVEEDASDEDAVVEGPELPPSMKSAKRGGGSRDRRGGRGASRSRSGSRDRRGGRGERDRDRDRRRGDRERERDRRRSRSRSGGDRRRSRSREDDRRRRRQSEREEREREERRKREKRLAKEREEYRRRQEKKRREREREEEKERERRRKERAKREKKEEEKRKKEEEERRRRREEQGPTLTDILLENPGLSMQAALQKLAEVTARRAAEKAAQAGMSMLGLAGLGSLAVPGAGPNPANVLQNKALTKPYRDIYIGNLPEGTTGPQLQEALCALLAQMGLVNGPGEPITSTWVSGDGHYAFCEFRTIEEANNATKLNGIVLGTSTIKVGRPKNYAGPANPDSATVAALLNGQPIPASAAAAPPAPPDPVALAQQLAAQTNPTVPGGAGAPPPAAAVPVPPGVTAGSAANLLGGLAGFAGAPAPAVPMPGLLMGGGGAKPEDGLLAAQKAAAAMVPGMTPAMAVAAAQSAPDSRVIMLTNLPEACDASQVEELVKPFGTVTRFNLLTDHEGRSKGTAVFEYEDIGACELAMKGLKDLPIGDKRLAAQTVPTAMAETLLKKVEVTAADLRPVKETRVISLTNMVTAEELADDQEFEDIKEDVADECNKFGTVKSIEIPRPVPGGGSGVAVPGLGRIFVEFADTVGANKARKSLAGRTFGGKKVEATYFPEDLYERKVFDENMAAVTSNDDNNIVEEKSQDNEEVGEDNDQKIEEDETNGGQQPPPPPSGGAAVENGGAPSPPPLPQQDEDDMD